MRILTDELAELQAEHDWLVWKFDENKKFKKAGESEFSYADDKESYSKDKQRLQKLKKILRELNVILRM